MDLPKAKFPILETGHKLVVFSIGNEQSNWHAHNSDFFTTTTITSNKIQADYSIIPDHGTLVYYTFQLQDSESVSSFPLGVKKVKAKCK